MSNQPPTGCPRKCDFVLRGVPMLDSPVSLPTVIDDALTVGAPRSGVAHGQLGDADNDFYSLSAPDPLVLPPGRTPAPVRHKKLQAETATASTTCAQTRTRTPVLVTPSPHAHALSRRISDRQKEIMRGDAANAVSKKSRSKSKSGHSSAPTATTEPAQFAKTTAAGVDARAHREPVFSATQQQSSTLCKRVKPVALPVSVKVSRVSAKPQSSSSSLSISRSGPTADDATQRRAVYTAVEVQQDMCPLHTTTVPYRGRLEHSSTSRRASVSEAPRDAPATSLHLLTGSSSTSTSSGVNHSRLQRPRHVDSSGDMSVVMNRVRRDRSHASSSSSQLSGFTTTLSSATPPNAAALGHAPVSLEAGGTSHSLSARPPVRPLQPKYFTSLERKDRHSANPGASPAREGYQPHRASIVHVSSQTVEDVFLPPHAEPAPRVMAARVPAGVTSPAPTSVSGQSLLSPSYTNWSLFLEGWLTTMDSSPVAEQGGARGAEAGTGGGHNADAGAGCSPSLFLRGDPSPLAAGSRGSFDDARSSRDDSYDLALDSAMLTPHSTHRAPAPPLHLAPSPSVSDTITSSTSFPNRYMLATLSSSEQQNVDAHRSSFAQDRLSAGAERTRASRGPVPSEVLPDEGHQPPGHQRESLSPRAVLTPAAKETRALPQPPPLPQREPPSQPGVGHAPPGTAAAAAGVRTSPDRDQSLSLDSTATGDAPFATFALSCWDATNAEGSTLRTHRDDPVASSRTGTHSTGGDTPAWAAGAQARRETWPATTHAISLGDGRRDQSGTSSTHPARPVAYSVGDNVVTRRFIPAKDRNFSIPSCSVAGMTSSNLGDSSTVTHAEVGYQKRLSASSRTTGSTDRGAGHSGDVVPTAPSRAPANMNQRGQ